MNRVLRTAGAGVLAVVTLAASGCSNKNNVSAQDGFNQGNGTYTRVALDKRQQAPVLTGTALDGKKLSTASYGGKVLVLNVWGSWCAPCRKEAPALEQAAQKTKGTAQFIGIDTRDADVAQGTAFQRAFKVSYPSLFDPDGKLLLGFGHLPPRAIPTTIIVDRQGRIAARVLGATDASTIEGTISDIAAGK